MSLTASAEERGWSGRRWRFYVSAVLLLQLQLILVLSDRKPAEQRVVKPSPGIHLLNADPELLALSDPTLLVLPRPQGLSGNAWLRGTNLNYKPAEASEAPMWLAIRPEELGADFKAYVKANPVPGPAPTLEPRPELTIIPAPALGLLPVKSELKFSGDVADALLAAPPALPSWPHPDILTNTVVAVLVDSVGQTFSANLVASSGLPDADQFALQQARAMRYRAVEGEAPAARMRFGQLIFAWHTVAP